MRRAAYRILREAQAEWLVAEGDRQLFAVWERGAGRLDMQTQLVPAETWRRRLLKPRQARSSRRAKLSADTLAREVIERCQGPRPTSLRSDAAEAILIGFWMTLELGWQRADLA